MADITDLAHERDGDGELLPVEKEVQVRGEEEPVDVEVYPATSGQRREWKRKLDEAPEELGDDLQEELFDEFLPYDPEDFGGAESWVDIRPALEDALADAIFSEIFDTGEDGFQEALQEAMDEVTADSGNSEPAPVEMETEAEG